VNDTSPSVEARFRQMMLARAPEQRLAMAARMFATAKALILAGLLHEHGQLSPGEIRRLTFERLYGLDFSEATKQRILRHLNPPPA